VLARTLRGPPSNVGRAPAFRSVGWRVDVVVVAAGGQKKERGENEAHEVHDFVLRASPVTSTGPIPVIHRSNRSSRLRECGSKPLLPPEPFSRQRARSCFGACLGSCLAVSGRAWSARGVSGRQYPGGGGGRCLSCFGSCLVSCFGSCLGSCFAGCLGRVRRLLVESCGDSRTAVA
jgi:hypothetical protein